MRAIFYVLVALFTTACAKAKLGPLEVEVTESDNWFTVGSLVLVFLLIYLGIKVINKFVK